RDGVGGVVRGHGDPCWRAAAPASMGKDGAVRVLTWNLWWRYGPWQARRAAIAATLAEVDPDICGLQEVWGTDTENFAAELAERLGRHWCWARASTGRDGVGIGNAVLSRWPIVARVEQPLPTGEPIEA